MDKYFPGRQMLGPNANASSTSSSCWCICEPAGTICVLLAYSILLSSAYVILFQILYTYDSLPWLAFRLPLSLCYAGIVAMAVWCHLACMLTDPGAVRRCGNEAFLR
eukprot:g14256.t1